MLCFSLAQKPCLSSRKRSREQECARKRGSGGGERREISMRLEIGTERGMHAELSFYIHLHASMGSAPAAGWSRQREDAVTQCDLFCSAASTVSSLSSPAATGESSPRPRQQARLFHGRAPSTATTLVASLMACNPGQVSSAATLTARLCWWPAPVRRLQCRALTT